MEKEGVFCQRSMLNTAYSIKAFEPRLNKMKGKVRACTLSSVDMLSLPAMVGGKGYLPIFLILDERPNYESFPLFSISKSGLIK